VIRPVVSSSYKSNVKGLGKELDERIERIVARAARDGSAHVRSTTKPPINAFATGAETSGRIVRAAVIVSKAQWWATIFDKGSLGKRVIPLKQPGRREMQWKIKRRGRAYTARRSQQALAAGGIEPQYFLIRGKRLAERKLREYLIRGL
jgi:hypothetical protein